MKILVLSCDKYENTWDVFFKLLDKYYPNHPETYLSCETKKCKYCKTINTNTSIWTKRFRESLKKIKDEYVLVLLDDFFIRKTVDQNRINYALESFDKDTIVFNFEKKYRKTKKYSNIKGFEIQKNNQIYLNSCQPSIWDRKKLIERLKKDESAWEWEKTIVNSPYKHYINTKGYIIDIGNKKYNFFYWGISRGKLTFECKLFLKKEHLRLDWDNKKNKLKI